MCVYACIYIYNKIKPFFKNNIFLNKYKITDIFIVIKTIINIFSKANDKKTLKKKYIIYIFFLKTHLNFSKINSPDIKIIITNTKQCKLFSIPDISKHYYYFLIRLVVHVQAHKPHLLSLVIHSHMATHPYNIFISPERKKRTN